MYTTFIINISQKCMIVDAWSRTRWYQKKILTLIGISVDPTFFVFCLYVSTLLTHIITLWREERLQMFLKKMHLYFFQCQGLASSWCLMSLKTTQSSYYEPELKIFQTKVFSETERCIFYTWTRKTFVLLFHLLESVCFTADWLKNTRHLTVLVPWKVSSQHLDFILKITKLYS